ncbi:MAG: hypothetical protein JNM56_19795 [Planctomycetia bacterium]|nr:hypothetical protein [Planctomycetia bacterium]
MYEVWMGGNLNDALLFHGMRLHFGVFSVLDWVVVHQREDAYLFDRPVHVWTRDSILVEMQSQGYLAQTLANGDVDVERQLSLSFAADGRLDWVEIYTPRHLLGLAAAAVWRWALSPFRAWK